MADVAQDQAEAAIVRVEATVRVVRADGGDRTYEATVEIPDGEGADEAQRRLDGLADRVNRFFSHIDGVRGGK